MNPKFSNTNLGNIVPTPLAKKTYKVKQLASLLEVSTDTIYRMKKNGELPPIIETERRLIRWLVKDIELWFDLDCPTTKNFVRYKKDSRRFSDRNKRRR